MTLPLLSDLDVKNLINKTVLVRVDFNVPIKDGQILNSYRIDQSLATIKYLSEIGAKVVLLSHLGSETASLKPVANYLNKILPVKFSAEVWPEDMIKNLSSGDILLVENLRQTTAEVNNDQTEVKKWAELAHFYVNDAFSASHRVHGSIVGLPQFLPSVAGFLFQREYENLLQVFNAPKPFVVIVGGAKFKTKWPALKRLAELADQLFVGGALAHPIFKHLGYNLGQSLQDDDIDLPIDFLKQANLSFPVDVIVKTNNKSVIKLANQVDNEDVILDAGPQTVAKLKEVIKTAKFVLWNGPLGNFEAGFRAGTEALAKDLAKLETYSIVGGGDTVLAISELGLLSQFDFVSTAGGAMLDFIATGTLPGIEALTKNSNLESKA